jgi:hypothetical protein
MKKLLFILFLFIGSLSYGQTVFTQTYVDRCTGDVKVVVANFVNGSATVAFYNRVRTFTYQEFLAGELQAWLTETYTWWNALSPCSTATAETQAAQQTAQNATAAAQTAQSAAANAAAAVPPPVSTPPPSTTNTTSTNATSGTNTTGSTSQNTSGSTTSGNEQSSSGTSSGGTEGGTTDSGSSTEGSTNEGGQTSEGQGGDTSSETKSESKSESDGGGSDENKDTESKETESSEETKEESKEEEVKEESKEEESSEEESSEEKEEESSEEKEEEKKEEKKEKKQSKMMPIQLRSDIMANQALLGNYDVVTSIGATQSSIFGDESYGATLMIWSNLRQFSLNTSYTKVHMEKLNLSTITHGNHTHYSKTNEVSVKDPITPPTPKLKSITSASVGYMNNFGNGATVANMMKIKPTKYGTFGAGINMGNMFGEGQYQMTMIGYNVLYTNQVMLNSRINYAPAFIWTQTPFVTRVEWERDEWGKNSLTARNQMRGQRIHGMMILANSFTIQLTRRFSFNAGATFIKSTDPNIPLIKSFMIGAKLPF